MQPERTAVQVRLIWPVAGPGRKEVVAGADLTDTLNANVDVDRRMAIGEWSEMPRGVRFSSVKLKWTPVYHAGVRRAHVASRHHCCSGRWGGRSVRQPKVRLRGAKTERRGCLWRAARVMAKGIWRRLKLAKFCAWHLPPPPTPRSG